MANVTSVIENQELYRTSQAMQLVQASNISATWWSDLSLLYRPLIGPEALQFYFILQSVALYRNEVSLSELRQWMNCSNSVLHMVRIRLEQYNLLRTFQNQEAEICKLQLCAPLTGQQFLEHAVFARALFNKIGEEQFGNLVELIQPKIEENDHLQEISQVLSTKALEESWTSDAEKMLQSLTPRWDHPQDYDFDWKTFLDNAERLFPARLRTPENLNRIAYLANVYGVSAADMRVKLSRSLRDGRTWIDFDHLTSQLATTTKIEKPQQADPSDYSQKPVHFLQARQKGNAKVLPSERKMIDELIRQYEFSNELINTILDYAMETNQGQLIVPIVNTIANNVARNNIKTRDEALEFFSKAPKKISKRKYSSRNTIPESITLPKWYEVKESEKGTDEDVAKILALQEELLKGGSSHGTD